MPTPDEVRRAELQELAELEELAALEAEAARLQPRVIQVEEQEITPGPDFQPAPEPSQFKTATDHLTQGIFLGGLPQVSAGVMRAKDYVTGEDGPSYEQYRDHYQGVLDRGAYAHPKTAMASELAGTFATGAAASALAPATVLGQGGAGAVTGATSAAAESGGDLEATATGGALGGLLGAAGGKLMQLFRGRQASIKAAEEAAEAARISPHNYPGSMARPKLPTPDPKPTGPSLREVARDVAKVAGAETVSSAAGFPGVGTAYKIAQLAGKYAPAAARATGEAAKSAGRGVRAVAEGAPRVGMPVGAAGAAPIPLRSEIRDHLERKQQRMQHDRLRKAYVNRSLSLALQAELADSIESGDSKKLAAKLDELQINPTLASELGKHMKGRK